MKIGKLLASRCIYARKALVVVVLTLAATQGWAQPENQDEIQAAYQLFHLTNQARTENNLPPLTWDESLAQAAAQHTQMMAGRRSLSHQFPGEPELALRAGNNGAHFRKIAENVAMGPSAPGLQAQWMKSPPHRANILDPQLTGVGISVVRTNGYLYATEDFATRVESLSTAEVEQRVSTLLIQRGLTIAAGQKQSARQTCTMDSGVAGGTSPGFIMRWEGSDLGHLPDVLQKRISSGHYHSASVGSCRGASPKEGFTSYRIAVLLY